MQLQRDRQGCGDARLPGPQPRRIACGRIFDGRRHRLGGLRGVGRRRRGRRRGRRLRRSLGVADLNLAGGRQAAVVGGQAHVELGDEAAVAARAGGRAAVGSLQADRQLAPVAERDLRHAGGDGLATDLQVRDATPARVAAGARIAGARRGARGDRVRGDLTLEERERSDRALSLRGRVRLDRRGRARSRRLRRDDRAVGGIRERAGRRGRRVRRRDDHRRGDRARGRRRDLDRPGGRSRARGARRSLGAGRPEGEQREGQKQCEEAAHRS